MLPVMLTIVLTAHDQERLRYLGVATVYLFGSHATGTAGPRSDYDVGILMQPGVPTPERLDATYDRLYALLADRFPRTLENDVIDIVFLERAPLELRTHVVRYGILLFDERPRERVRFEEQTLAAYRDYFPLLRELDRAILASV